MQSLLQDVRYGLRMLSKKPWFTLIAIITLALGIGANTAIFSVVNAVLLRPLPYPEPDRLVMVFTYNRKDSKSKTGPAFGPDFTEWRNQNQVFEQIAAHGGGSSPVNLVGGGEPDRVRAARVTTDLFLTLGVKPLIGRTFLPEEKGRVFWIADGQPPGDSVVILSYRIWQNRFGSDPAIVGKTVKVEGDTCTVVGIMPAGFQYPNEADLWLPMFIEGKRNNSYLWVIGRLKPGVTREQAEVGMETIARRLGQEFPKTNQGIGISLVPLHEYLVGKVRLSLLVFLGAVGFVLLIACANVANLMLARAATRWKEMAIRTALGAKRLRIIRQLLTESIMLALLGGSLGLLLALWGLDVLISFAPQNIPRLNAIVIDRWVLGFTVLLSMLTGIIFGLTPAVRVSKPNLNEALKEGGVQSTGAVRQRLSGVLVITEVALTSVLLIGAGLLIRSFVLLLEVKPGFNPDHVLTASITLPESLYRTSTNAKDYYQRALERITVLPEVQAASVVSSLPLGKTGARIRGDFTVEGEAEPRPNIMASKLAIGHDYFRAMGVPLLKGRDFTELDTEQSPGVLIISESLARSLWPNGDAIGKRLNLGFRGETWREIVGVVGDIRQEDLGAGPLPAIYQPYLQMVSSRRWMVGGMTFVIRTIANPENVAAGLRHALQAVDKELPLYDVMPMERVVSQKVSDPRFYTLLLGTFSALALLLAIAGIYGVISYSVTQRTHEIGIRMALGARSADVLKLVVGQGMKLTLVGVAIGLAGASVITHLLTGFLHQVSATDPVTFVLTALLLTVVALLACYIPARRATKVDPMIALRYE